MRKGQIFFFAAVYLFILPFFNQNSILIYAQKTEFLTKEMQNIHGISETREGSFYIWCDSRIKEEWNSGGTTYLNDPLIYPLGPPADSGNYHWEGDVLSITWDYIQINPTGDPWRYNGSMIFIVDKYEKIIKKFQGTESISFGQTQTTFSVELENVPFILSAYFYDSYGAQGENAGSYITSLNYQSIQENVVKTLESYSFNDGSYIQIDLIKAITVLDVSGEVELLRKGEESNPIFLKGGEFLRKSDRIYTDVEASAIIQFPDNSLVTLKELTDVKVGELTHNALTVRERLWLAAGKVTAEVNGMSGVQSDFAIKTPTATCSVRGTRFTVDYNETGEETDISVSRGSVDVVNDTSSFGFSLSKNSLQDTLRLNAWEKVIVSKSGIGQLTNIVLQSINILPAEVILEPGDSIYFSAEGVDVQNNTVGVGGVWSATGGSIDTLGYYRAGIDSGSFSVNLVEPDHNLMASSVVIIKDFPVSVGYEQGILKIFSLDQNYPNPFNPNTNIKFGLAKRSKVYLAIYNLLGEEVITLINDETRNAGNHEISISGNKLSSGVYFINLKAGDFTATKKIVLIK